MEIQELTQELEYRGVDVVMIENNNKEAVYVGHELKEEPIAGFFIYCNDNSTIAPNDRIIEAFKAMNKTAIIKEIETVNHSLIRFSVEYK